MNENPKYKVSDLKPLKNHMYLITVGDLEYQLHEETILKYRLVKGKGFEDLDIILKDNFRNILYAKIRSYALRYPKSKHDLKIYLANKYDLDDILLDEIISRLEKEGIINDNLYRESLIHSLQAKGYGKNYIYNALRAKGLEEVEILDNQEILSKLILKQLRNYENLDENKKKSKITNYLIRKGYSYFAIKNELDKYL